MANILNEKKQLVVPVSIQRKAGIKAGDQLEFKASRGVITILPKLPSADDEYTPEQRRKVDAELAKGLQDLKEGRTYGPFNTADEMIASMKQQLKIREPLVRKPSTLDEDRVHQKNRQEAGKPATGSAQGLLQAGPFSG